MNNKIASSIKKLMTSGFFSIFGATVINSVVSFVYGIFLVRVLSKYDYGLFSYIQNVTNFGVLFCSLGVNLGVLQFCSENVDREKKNGYAKFALQIGTICSILMIGVMVLYTFVDQSGFENLIGYIIEFSLLPLLFFAKEWVSSNLRWQLKNKEYGNMLNVHSVSNAVFAIAGAALGGIRGVIIGIYLAYLCSILVGAYYLKGDFFRAVKDAALPDKSLLGKFMKYSVTMCVVNALISVLFTVDTFVIGNIMKDAEQVAMYKAASVIPFALNMIPNSIMTFVYPHVACNRDNKKWLKKNIRLLYLANGTVNLCIGIVLFIMAPIVITIFFGNKYEGILTVFRILVVSYMVSSCLRTPAANLFGIMRKTKTAFFISAGTVVLSVCMSVILVGRFGIIGAACGSVITFATVGIISTGILVYDIYLKK